MRLPLWWTELRGSGCGGRPSSSGGHGASAALPRPHKRHSSVAHGGKRCAALHGTRRRDAPPAAADRCVREPGWPLPLRGRVAGAVSARLRRGRRRGMAAGAAGLRPAGHGRGAGSLGFAGVVAPAWLLMPRRCGPCRGGGRSVAADAASVRALPGWWPGRGAASARLRRGRGGVSGSRTSPCPAPASAPPASGPSPAGPGRAFRRGGRFRAGGTAPARPRPPR